VIVNSLRRFWLGCSGAGKMINPEK